MDYIIHTEHETSTDGPETNHDGLPGKSSRESTGGRKASLAKPLGTARGQKGCESSVFWLENAKLNCSFLEDGCSRLFSFV